MTIVFPDTWYWVATSRPRDHWQEQAVALAERIGEARIVTTDEVLTEFLTALAGAGAYLRRQAVVATERIRSNPNVTVIAQSRATFDAGLSLYGHRPDKSYSLTDCV